MQGAERADRDRKTLPRGLDAVPVPRAAASRREDAGQRRDQLLHLGGLGRNPGPGQERADRDGQWQRLSARAGERRVRDAAHPVSGGRVPEERRRAHRRSERGMEGEGDLDDFGDENAIS